MEILFGGVRGTTPRAEPAFAVYGGHTTCVLVTGAAGERLMLDAGSGVHVANAALAGDTDLDLMVLFTHLHLDHVMGLPMLAPLFAPDARIELASVSDRDDGPRKALDRLVAPPLWPLGLNAVPAAVGFRGIPPRDLESLEPILRHGDLEIRGCALPHPNGCTAWRVDEPSTGASFVFATDMEWAAAGPARREAIGAMCHGADLLAMDGHFTAEEIAERQGWGHSSLDECAELAREARVRQLLVIHHAPDNDDEHLTGFDRHLTTLLPGAALARQGQTVVLDGSHG